tara:strand:- start:50 stop:529 length:480 start_codon:yes stop_codon:yes gene_type:complete
MKILDKLSTYAALIGTVTAIGGGFYAWGEFNNRLSVLEGEPPVNLQPLHSKDKELSVKISENLDLTNEYKVDLIDRIEKVDDKIVPVDLTTVFGEIAKVRESIAMIDIPNISGLKKDIKEIKDTLTEMEKNIAIALKENELQDTMIEEIKLKSNNPLAK